jgi:hypothetical protein
VIISGKRSRPAPSGPRLVALAVSMAACVLFVLAYAGESRAQSKNRPGEARPTTSGIDTFPRVGVETHDSMSITYRGVADAGGMYTRVHLYWSEIEPANTTPQDYTWSTYDAIFTRVISEGVTPLVIIMGCPAWACPDLIGPLNRNMNGEVAQFAGALAARYSAPPYNIHYYEMWNEPDGSAGANHERGWGAFPDRYAQMLASVYPAIKAVDPQSVIMSGGVAYSWFWEEGGPFNRGFLAGMLAAGGGQYIDAVGYHYYSNDPRYAHVGDKARVMKQTLGPVADAIPFICTESGLTSDPVWGSSEAIQARYLAKMYTYAAKYDVRSVVWYLYRDYTSPDPKGDYFAKSGLVTVNNIPKPSFRAMQTFASEIGSGQYIRQLRASDGLPPEVEGYRFSHASGDSPFKEVSIVWTNPGAQGPYTVTVPADLHVLRAVDINGNPVSTTTNTDGSVSVQVGIDPMYVEVEKPRYVDVPFTSWAHEYVEYLAERWIVNGYGDGTFQPGNTATRGQFSKMIVLGMSWQVLNPGTNTFADVPTDSPFYRYVETAASHSIIGGYPCGGPGEPCDSRSSPYFRPGNNITRAQIAKIIVLGKGWPTVDPLSPTFADIPRGSTFYTYIETAARKGAIAGYACDSTPGEPCDPQNRPYFRPGNNATRAQLSKMLAVALQSP